VPLGRAGSPVAYASCIDPRRQLPSVDHLLHALDPELPHGLRVQIARSEIDDARARVARGEEVAPAAVLDEARRRAAEIAQQLLRPLINATGVLLHTNLGRAPLDRDTLDAMERIAGASNLEYRIAEGARGSRHDHAGHLLAAACGADAGMVVNNNAGAVLLALAALARGRTGIVSRGELVEIGGGFRVPEIMAESGTTLVEVGTTNRTRIADYARAITDDTALVLKVHASNYRMVGFVESTPVSQLAELGPPVMVDAGSGLLDERTPWLSSEPTWLRDELGIRQCVEAGAALVTFSGDKLLGGPQAGIIVGRRDIIERCRRHPLARALRADKMTLAALQHVALAYLDGRAGALPFWRMATASLESLRVRAETMTSCVAGTKVVETNATAGAGSVPGREIPSIGLAFETPTPDTVARRLRERGVVARIERGSVICDLRSVDPNEDDACTTALRTCTSNA
jgi:L-seryl-tRNA(Ser) seleniumtransferase